MSARTPTDPTNHSRAGAIVIGCLVGFLLGEIIAAILIDVGSGLAHLPGGLNALSKLSEPPWWSNVLGLVGLWVGFGAAIYFSRAHAGLANLEHQWTVRPYDVVYVALGVACQVIVDVGYAPFHLQHLNKPVNHLFGSAHGVTFVLLALMTMVGAPFMEEWFFRGVLFRALDEGFARRFARGATPLAVGLSAVLFAAAHAEPLQFVGLAALGVVLALLVKRTQRLAPSIITHVSFNAVALVSLVAQRSGH